MHFKNRSAENPKYRIAGASLTWASWIELRRGFLPSPRYRPDDNSSYKFCLQQHYQSIFRYSRPGAAWQPRCSRRYQQNGEAESSEFSCSSFSLGAFCCRAWVRSNATLSLVFLLSFSGAIEIIWLHVVSIVQKAYQLSECKRLGC